MRQSPLGWAAEGHSRQREQKGRGLDVGLQWVSLGTKGAWGG